MTQKRYSTTALLKWALVHAIADRESFLDAMAGCNSPAEEEYKANARELVKAFEELLRTKKTFKATGDILFKACVYAESDRAAFLDSVHYRKGKEGQEPYVLEEAAKFEQMRALRLKVWGRTRMEADLAQAGSVAVEGIINRPAKGSAPR